MQHYKIQPTTKQRRDCLAVALQDSFPIPGVIRLIALPLCESIANDNVARSMVGNAHEHMQYLLSEDQYNEEALIGQAQLICELLTQPSKLRE